MPSIHVVIVINKGFPRESVEWDGVAECAGPDMDKDQLRGRWVTGWTGKIGRGLEVYMRQDCQVFLLASYNEEVGHGQRNIII